jgi:hypothetical protein
VKGATLRAGALLASSVLLLVACTPLYLPPIPGDALVPEPRLRLLGESGLSAAEGAQLQLTLLVGEVPHPGWLAVQWFGPAGGVVASESLWLEREDAGHTVRLSLPEGIPLRPGEWRAVVSWYGELVRQFRLRLP